MYFSSEKLTGKRCLLKNSLPQRPAHTISKNPPPPNQKREDLFPSEKWWFSFHQAVEPTKEFLGQGIFLQSFFWHPVKVKSILFGVNIFPILVNIFNIFLYARSRVCRRLNNSLNFKRRPLHLHAPRQSPDRVRILPGWGQDNH